MISKKLKILFAPIDAVGHVMACIGVAEALAAAGHQVMFAIVDYWKETLVKCGFEVITLKDRRRKENEDPAQFYAKMLVELDMFKSSTPLNNILNMWTKVNPGYLVKLQELDEQIEAIIKQIQPDVIMVDQSAYLPSVVHSDIPWVLVASANILYYIEDERTPPATSGLPAVGHEIEWKEFRNAVKEGIKDIRNEYNEYFISKGIEPLKKALLLNCDGSKYMNIYSYPQELDYTDLRPLPPNWYAFDNFKRSEKQSNFEIPVELREKSGKLIYLSMGSMGAADVKNMKRLVAILAKSKHRFIVSKGPLHDTYELPDNMFGQQSVPQIQVLPTVDLVITHGGNNTVTETFSFGKPMIVMPQLSDQFDNAQRIQDKGFGLRLDAYTCTEEELLNGIENLLNDKELNEKLKTISMRIQSENSIAKLPKLIESMVYNNNDFNNNIE